MKSNSYYIHDTLEGLREIFWTGKTTAGAAWLMLLIGLVLGWFMHG